MALQTQELESDDARMPLGPDVEEEDETQELATTSWSRPVVEEGIDPTEYEEASPAEDSVRLYLSEMGAVPLLS